MVKILTRNIYYSIKFLVMIILGIYINNVNCPLSNY